MGQSCYSPKTDDDNGDKKDGEEDLLPQPDDPKFRTAVVQICVRHQSYRGNDRRSNAHRYDSTPIANGMIKAGMSCELLDYNHKEHDDFFYKCRKFDALIVRCKPGQIKADGGDQAKFDEGLRALHKEGKQVLPSPDVMEKMGAKDAVCKVARLSIGLEDTFAYYAGKDFCRCFKKTMAFQPRVIKQNRGSAGEDIWIIWLKDGAYCGRFGDRQCSDADMLRLVYFEDANADRMPTRTCCASCTCGQDANARHEEEHSVAEFIEFCVNGRTKESEKSGPWKKGVGKYLAGSKAAGGKGDAKDGKGDAMLVDQRFCPRFAKGELRYWMVGDELVGILHKTPKQGGSGTGSIYKYYGPEEPKFKTLTDNLQRDLPKVLPCLGLQSEPFPLSWTADFISASPENADQEKWTVGKFSCSCVGISKDTPDAEQNENPPPSGQEAKKAMTILNKMALLVGDQMGEKVKTILDDPPKPVNMGPVDTSAPTNGGDLLVEPIYKTAQIEIYVPPQLNDGADKSPNGHRYYSIPIAKGMINSDMSCQLIHYVHEEHDAFFEDCKKYNALILRCTLDQIKEDGGDVAKFADGMRKLSKQGVKVWNSPDVMQSMGTKSALVRLAKLDIGLKDTLAYYDEKEFAEGVKKSLGRGPRVIKQNRGASGAGIWIVKQKAEKYGQKALGDTDELSLVEVSDGHKLEHTVAEFIEFCTNGRTAKAGTWVDQSFCPRVAEGELQFNMVGATLASIIHKKSKEGGISTGRRGYENTRPEEPKPKTRPDKGLKLDLPRFTRSLIPGSKPIPPIQPPIQPAKGGVSACVDATCRSTCTRYSPEEIPEEYKALADKFLEQDLAKVISCLKLGRDPIPLWWTVQFIQASKEGEKEKWIVSDVNCSCDVSWEGLTETEETELGNLMGAQALATLRREPRLSEGPVDISSLTSFATDDLGLDPQPAKPKYKTALIEIYVRPQRYGGADKSSNGHRYDSIPIANGMINSGMSCQLIHYVHEEHEEFIQKCKMFDALIVRCNPGHIHADGGSQQKFDESMRALRKAGKQVLPSPDVMEKMGAKDALCKVNNLSIGLEDTKAYYTADEFNVGFRKTIAFEPRVIKQNRGSAGEGIWIVKLKGGNYGERSCEDKEALCLMEANDNHEEEHTVAQFIEFCTNGRTAKAGTWTSVGKGKYLEGIIRNPVVGGNWKCNGTLEEVEKLIDAFKAFSPKPEHVETIIFAPTPHCGRAKGFAKGSPIEIGVQNISKIKEVMLTISDAKLTQAHDLMQQLKKAANGVVWEFLVEPLGPAPPTLDEQVVSLPCCPWQQEPPRTGVQASSLPASWLEKPEVAKCATAKAAMSKAELQASAASECEIGKEFTLRVPESALRPGCVLVRACADAGGGRAGEVLLTGALPMEGVPAPGAEAAEGQASVWSADGKLSGTALFRWKVGEAPPYPEEEVKPEPAAPAPWKDDGGPIKADEKRQLPEDKAYYTYAELKEKLSAEKDQELEDLWRQKMKPQAVVEAQATLASGDLGGGPEKAEHQDGGGGGGEGPRAAEVAKDGLNWVLVGHSERRSLYGETDEDCATKTALALEAGLNVMLCIGETLEERQGGSASEACCATCCTGCCASSGWAGCCATGATTVEATPGKKKAPGPADSPGSAKRRAEGGDAASPAGAGAASAEPRPRHSAEELLRDAIIGYVDDGGDDPAQSGVTAPRQSEEVQGLAADSGEEVPIAKDQRAGYVWVAAASRGARKKYTWNVDRIVPLPAFKDAKDNTCDVCGASCTEVLYEFRCYKRLRPGTERPADRKLHPFVSYISKECGKGLLGEQTETERERLYHVFERQMTAVIPKVTDWSKMVIAYEPGAGVDLTPMQAQDTHFQVRQVVRDVCDDAVADAVRILYGGSVDEKNCKAFGELPDVDGFLVGGASMKPNFTKIIGAAQDMVKPALLRAHRFCGPVVDQRFCERIEEGELRYSMVGDSLVGIIHKKPTEGGISAVGGTGSIYTHYDPNEPKFETLTNQFKRNLPELMKCLDLDDEPFPLWWTTDFILASRKTEKDKWIVGEFNCSCVGISKCLAAYCKDDTPKACWDSIKAEDQEEAKRIGDKIGEQVLRAVRRQQLDGLITEFDGDIERLDVAIAPTRAAAPDPTITLAFQTPGHNDPKKDP